MSYLAHITIHGQEIPSQSNDYGSIKLHQQSLNGRCGIYRMSPNLLEHSPDNFFNQMDRLLKKTIYNDLNDDLNWKASINLNVVMCKKLKQESYRQNFVLTTKLEAIHDFDEWYRDMITNLTNSIEDFQLHGSDWTLDEIKFAEFKFLHYQSQSGSGTFPLDSVLKNKKAVINLDVDDSQCFRYAVLCALHAKDIEHNHNRPSKYKQYLNEIDMDDIDEPVQISDIYKFEKQNPNIKVNVNYWKNGQLLRALYNNSNACNRKHVVNLIFVHNENLTRSHYLPVINFNRLMRKNHEKKMYCERCYRKFDSRHRHRYEKHLKFCMQNKLQREENAECS